VFSEIGKLSANRTSSNKFDIDWLRIIIIYYDLLWKQIAVVIVFGVFSINPRHKQFLYSYVVNEGFKLPEMMYFYALEIYSKSSMLYAVNISKMVPFTVYIAVTSWALNQIQYVQLSY